MKTVNSCRLFVVIVLLLAAQNVSLGQSVGIGTTNPDPSAMLDITAAGKGLLIPRVALTDASDVVTIPSPASSLLIYNTATSGSGSFAVSPGFYFYNSLSLSWTALTVSDNSLKGAWLLGGNLGTSPITNFVGTSDNQALLFKINNQNSGYLGLAGNAFWGLNSGNVNSNTFSNVAIGNAALSLNTNKSNLVAVGDSALLNNGIGASTTLQGVQNTAVGSKVLFTNNVGSYNTGVGYNALLANNSGTQNTATGVDALHYNSTGILNSAFGNNTLFLNSTGSNNSATGANSLVNNSTGNNNTANGFGALFSNTTGFSNVAIGNNAMRLNTSKSNIVAIGDSALFNNGANNPAGSQSIHNTAVGSKALYANTIGTDNTATGFNALSLNVSGINNTAFGSLSLDSNTLGNYNTAAGTGALSGTKTGNYNTAFGNGALRTGDGGYNTAVGGASMYFNISGNNNVAVGQGSLLYNATGFSNVALGSQVLVNNISNNNLVAIGDSAMYNLFGNNSVHNTAVGSKSLFSLTSGNGNTALGYQTLFKNTSVANTAVGDQAMYNNTSGNVNVAIGSGSMLSNINGNGNVAVGSSSLSNNLSGNNNTSSGHFALSSNTIGSENTGIGYSALNSNMEGYGNVAVGKSALNSNISGFNNIGIGYNADVASNSLSNATAVGTNAQVACNDCMVLGSIGGVNGALFDVKVGIGTTSPQTKLHVSPNGAGSILIGTNRTSGGFTNLEMGISSQSGGYSYIQSTTTSGIAYGNLLLNQFGGNVGIRVTTPLAAFHLKQSSEAYPINGGGIRLERQTNTNHWEIGTDNGDDFDFVFNGVSKGYISNVTGAFTVVSDQRMKKDIQTIGTVLPELMQLQPKTYHYIDNKTDAPLSYGFIAQEVEKLFPDFVITKGVDNMKAITYQNFNVIAIKAIQEQQKEIDLLKEQNRMIMEEIGKLKAAK